ncbi:MAG TPA: T9SS type A sorting domain-containing protein [Flavisolibacter sp.]|jgi:hypothetical protein|nr:T9SS type A sorting domain-containing protein [Flavisolibacter sp.]
MKRNFILFFLSLFVQSLVFAAPPTVPASGLTFSDIDGAQFYGRFTGGNGTYRMIVMKEGSPVTGVPVNGVEYAGDDDFGTPGTEFTAPGEYVITGRSSWASFTAYKLKPGTTYYIAVFEFNGTGAGTEYLSLPLTGSQATVVAPLTQTSALGATTVTGNTITLSWTKGGGRGRVILARKAAAVQETPADLTNYYAGDNIFGSGTKVGTDHFVVYKGEGASAVIKGLEPNTVYHFSFFEYNGNLSPMYLRPGAVLSAQTHAGPTIAPSSPRSNYVEGNSFSYGVTVGNGTHRLFIAKRGSPVTAVPVNGVTYTANAAFGTAGTEIAPGEFVVGATTGTGIGLTKLEPNTTYHFRVYEYDIDKSGNTYYLTGSYSQASSSTASTPTSIASNLSVSKMTGSSATVKFTIGNGLYRMVIMKAGSAVDAVPQDLKTYAGNANYGSGTQVAPDNYCVIGLMNGDNFTVNNLQPGITYHAAIYEYNGSSAPVYSATAATTSFTIPLEPTAVSTNPWSALHEGNSFRQIWTNGNGSARLVVARKGAAVTAKPADQVSYTANENFGQGQELAPGEFVVYDGTYNSVDLKNLEIGTTYHFAVYEYNTGVDGKRDYLTSSWLAAAASTLGRPATQVSIGSVSGIAATQATINFTKGDGASRLFVMRQGTSVTAAPQDLVKYNYNTVFGLSSTHMGDGNYVVLISGGTGNFTVTNLQPNTSYAVQAYEFNGSGAPAYLLSNPATTVFTTADEPGATVPTVAATGAQTEKADGNKLTLKWTSGNGEKRIVVMRKGSAVDFVPANATDYPANATFAAGTDLGGGQYIVYNNSGSAVDITNLLPSTTYHFRVYEYNGTGSLIRYLTASTLAATASTVTAPATPSSVITATPGSKELSLSWTKGNGSGRIVVLKEGSAVTGAPANLSVYPANAVFKSGSQIAPAEYVVYAGTGNSVTITGLSGQTYYYSIFEYNGSTAPVYNTAAVASGSAVVGVTLPVQWLSFTVAEKSGEALLRWATAREENNAYFVVERSTDGSRFDALTTIHSQGAGTGERAYSYTDKTPLQEKLYYRIKQVDSDGRFSYSDVRVLTVGNSVAPVQVYPNPATSHFVVNLPGSGTAVLQLFDARGVLVRQQRIATGQQVSVAGLSNGLYYLTVQTAGKEYKTSFVKK